MTAALQNLLEWIQLHPEWIGMAVFSTAMLESLAVVGILIPGVVIMFGFGALVGIGTLDFLVVMAWSVAGAVAGDGASFWLGHHYHDRLRDIRLFRRYAGLLDRGERFFHHHGSKSIVLGRLMGPNINARAKALSKPYAGFLYAFKYNLVTSLPDRLGIGVAGIGEGAILRKAAMD